MILGVQGCATYNKANKNTSIQEKAANSALQQRKITYKPPEKAWHYHLQKSVVNILQSPIKANLTSSKDFSIYDHLAVYFNGRLSLSDFLNLLIQQLAPKGIRVMSDTDLDSYKNKLYLPLKNIKTLAQLIQQINANTDLHVYIEKNNLHIGYLYNKVYPVEQLPGNNIFNLSVKGKSQSGGASGSGSSGNGATSNTSLTGDINIWNDIKANIHGLLKNKKNASFFLSQANSQIVVTASWNDQKMIQRYVNRLNKRLMQQVEIDIKVWNVQLKSSALSDLDGIGVLSFGGKFKLQLGGFNNTSSLTGAMGSALDNVGSGLQLSGSSNHVGFQSLSVNMLSNLGRVSIVDHPILTTTNNKLAAINNLLNTTYVSDSTTTQGTLGQGPTTTFSTDVLSTGLSIYVLPQILRDRQLLINIALSDSELLSMGSAGADSQSGTDGDTVKLPQYATKTFNQQFKVRNSRPIVVAGFIRSESKSQLRKNFGTVLLGGTSGLTNKVITVVQLTPHIIN